MKHPDWLKRSPLVVFGLLVAGILGLRWVVVDLPQRQMAPLSQKIKVYETSANPDPEKLAKLEKGRIEAENAIRMGLIQGVGGTAVLIGIYFTYRNLKVAEDKQVTERFSKAVEMIGNKDNLHVRLGGIYALERLAKDSDDDYGQVMEVLCAFVREESSWPPKQVTEVGVAEAKELVPVELSQWNQAWKEYEQRQKARQAFQATLPPLRTDIQAAMTVIGRRQHRYPHDEAQRLDLRQTDLRKLQADKANLTGVVLTGAHLEGANLEEAHLEYADLKDVQLEGANLFGAHLEGASLVGVHLERSGLNGANLEGCVSLLGAHLEGADLSNTYLERAFMRAAHLEEAVLIEAHLEGASLIEAHLEGANLSGTHLEKAYLTGVDLSQVLNLTQAQLNEADTDEHTILPDYLLAAQPSPPAPIAPPPPTTLGPNSEPPSPTT